MHRGCIKVIKQLASTKCTMGSAPLEETAVGLTDLVAEVTTKCSCAPMFRSNGTA
jgi:hypothetical protein